jgi:hypothetical protein
MTSSVSNRRNYDSFLSQNIDGHQRPSGMMPCYDSHSNTSYVGAAFNDRASGVYNSLSDGRC